MILNCENLCAAYNSNVILQDVNFRLQQGDFVCLCGPNGSGKSTFLKYLSGIEKSSDFITICKSEGDENSGKTWKFGECSKKIKLCDLSRKQIAQNIAFLQQNEFCAWDTVVFNLILTGRFAYSNGNYTKSDFEIVRECADFLEITNLLERNIYSLSGGEFQKCRIARMLAQKTNFLLLDEPTANLDILYEAELLKKLKKISVEQNVGVLISIHNINSALRFSNKIAFVKEKNIICDEPSKILTQQTIDLVYGKGLKIYTHPIYNCLQIG